jgi:hypothetical protein
MAPAAARAFALQNSLKAGGPSAEKRQIRKIPGKSRLTKIIFKIYSGCMSIGHEEVFLNQTLKPESKKISYGMVFLLHFYNSELIPT